MYAAGGSAGGGSAFGPSFGGYAGGPPGAAGPDGEGTGDIPVYPALCDGEWGSWENRPGQGPPEDPPGDGAWHPDAHP